MASALLGSCGDANPSAPAISSGTVTQVSGKAAIGGAYTLIDHTGKTVSDADYKGKAQLIYFGYAYCPDVCPAALQQLGAALALSGDAARAYQPLFISIDPERDTPEKLALYVTANGFPKGLIGLTGSVEQIEHAKKIFGVYGQKIEDPSNPDGFSYDHTSLIYLMDKNGEFVDIFTHADTPADMAKRLIEYSASHP
ncbi:MAG TPA: SCO family protein [Hellea balneolensis]|uniref:SCO family protein n=1 Tax=Hellea balneolensis TaxID=287478 RepID=A0A7C3G506_9PROT|nr:SCO family protein [Hellea balneolensis]